MANASDKMNEILAVLGRAERLSYYRTLLLSLLWGGAVAIAVVLLSRLQGLAAPIFPTVAAVLAASLVAGLAWAQFRGPGAPALARRADRLFDLGERVSTAVEVAQAPRGVAAVLQAELVADAARAVARVEPRRLVPLATPGVLAVALVVAAGALAVWLVPVPHEPAAPAVQELAASVDPSAAQDLRALAEALAQDAERRSNPYLAAVAAAVGELARTAEAGTDERLQAELAGLLDHARAAYGAGMPAWLRSAGSQLARPDGLREVARRATESRPQAVHNGGGAEEMVPETQAEQNPSLRTASAPLAVGEVRKAEEAGDLKSGSLTVDRGGAQADVTGKARPADAGGPAPTLGRKDGDPDSLDGAQALLAGGATQSSAGASRLAGAGTEDLNGAARDPGEARGRTDEVLLPPGSYRPGRQLRMQVAPQVAAGESTDGSIDAPAGPQRRDDLAATRDAPTLQDLDMFARLFTHGEARIGR
jgi:hypothetical protein